MDLRRKLDRQNSPAAGFIWRANMSAAELESPHFTPKDTSFLCCGQVQLVERNSASLLSKESLSSIEMSAGLQDSLIAEEEVATVDAEAQLFDWISLPRT